MAMLNLMETQFPELYSRGLYDDGGWNLGASQTDKVAATVFIAVSHILKDVKSKDYPVAFVFEDVTTELNSAAIIRYIPSEDETMPGHWNYVWTFDKADIPENARIIRLSDTDFQTYFRATAAEYHFGFHDGSAISYLGNYFMKQLSKWLQDNAKADEEVGIMLEGIFQARCIVEDNEVVKSLEVIGETKAIIKDDADNEV